MRTTRLVNLGCALFALGLAIPASAQTAPTAASVPDEAGLAVEASPEAAPPDAVPQDAETVPGAQASAEPAGDEMAQAASEAEPAAAEGAEVEAQVASDGLALPVESSNTDESERQASAPAAVPMELGAVGYDGEGREGRIHVVSSGDTLWDISDGYLGTPWVWPSIWQDNQKIENPHLIFPGDRIWITPWEMRKLTQEEADALLAGQPAAPEAMEPGFDPAAPTTAPMPAARAPMAEVVPAEQMTMRVTDRERTGLVTRETLKESSTIVANTTGRVLISESARAWIGLGEGDTHVGEQFSVFRVEDEVHDPETGRMLGYHVALLGRLEVIETHDETSLVVVKQSTSEMEVGDRIMPHLPVEREIAIRRGASGVEGRISFYPQSRTLAGSYDMVYLNRGTLDGVETGTPLTVYRVGHDAREQVRNTMVRVGDREIAQLVVVYAHDEASVALVRASEEELVLGDIFRGAAN